MRSGFLESTAYSPDARPYDFFFPVDTSQRFRFQLIGAPGEDKKWLVYETSHGLPRAEAMHETLAWLDKYFGSVPLR